MVTSTTQLKISSATTKGADKLPHSASKVNSKHSVSPDQSDEMDTLRARNKVLTDALQHIQETAKAELKHKYDLVWFAKYRYRYPNHEASQRIDGSKEHQEEIEKLRSDDGDFHHGFNCGVLAAARLFLDQSDVTHINNMQDLSSDMMLEASKHATKIQQSKEQFPHFEVTNEFPHREQK